MSGPAPDEGTVWTSQRRRAGDIDAFPVLSELVRAVWVQAALAVSDDECGLLLRPPEGSGFGYRVDDHGRAIREEPIEIVSASALPAGTWSDSSVLIWNPTGVDHSVWWFFRAGCFADPFAPRLVRSTQSATTASGLGRVEDDLAFMRPWGFDPSQVGSPLLLIHGGQDRIVPPGHLAWLAERCPRAVPVRFRVNRGCWYVEDHASSDPGSGQGRALWAVVLPVLCHAADNAGVAIEAIALSDRLARLYETEVPGLFDRGPAPRRGRRLRRDPV